MHPSSHFDRRGQRLAGKTFLELPAGGDRRALRSKDQGSIGRFLQSFYQTVTASPDKTI